MQHFDVSLLNVCHYIIILTDLRKYSLYLRQPTRILFYSRPSSSGPGVVHYRLQENNQNCACRVHCSISYCQRQTPEQAFCSLESTGLFFCSLE